MKVTISNVQSLSGRTCSEPSAKPGKTLGSVWVSWQINQVFNEIFIVEYLHCADKNVMIKLIEYGHMICTQLIAVRFVKKKCTE